MKRKLWIFFPILFLFLSFNTIASIQVINFDSKSGLVDNSVEVVFHDSYGYLWIGTFNGLSKFDGYKFQNYTIFDSVCGLPGGIIFDIFEDSHRNLWIGTNKELLLYNRSTDCFESLSDVPAAAISEIGEGAENILYVATFSGLFEIDIISKSLLRKFDELQGMPSISLTSLAIDSKKNIWVGSQDKGIFFIDGNSKKITIINSENSRVPTNRINCLVFDASGNLWIGTPDVGLFIYNTLSKEVKIYKNEDKSESINIGFDYISSVYISSDLKDIWLSRNGYLLKLNRLNDKFERYIPDFVSREFLNNKKISKIFSDRNNNIWVSSFDRGVFFLKKNNNNFNIISKTNLTQGNKYDNISNIRSIAKYGDTLVLGSDGNAILFKTKNTEIVSYKFNNMLTSPNIMSFCLYNDEIWCATWGGGVNIINLKDNIVKKLDFYNDKGELLNIENVRYISIIDNIAWIGTSGDGIFKYNLGKGKFESQQFNDTLNLRNLGWISCILKDVDNWIWISTFDKIFKIKGTEVKVIKNIPGNLNSLSSDVVYSLFEDSKKNIWIATNRALDKYDRKENSFTNWPYGTIPSLPRSIIEDKNNVIWVSTHSGIFSLNPISNRIEHYNELSGMPESEFNINASFRFDNGMICFGSKNGIVTFNPNLFVSDSLLPSTVVRNLFIDNQIQRTYSNNQLSKDICISDTLILNYSKSVVTFEISDLNHVFYPQIKYEYMFSGLSNKWIPVDDSRRISYTDIPPGEYILIIKSTYSNGNTSQKQLFIKIIPPWWKTIWFKIFSVLLVSVLLYLIYYLRSKYIREQNKLLKERIEEKTSALEQINNLLKDQNTKLTEKEFVLQIKNEELEDLNSTKDRLFSIIAHDLKNPLFAIMGISDLLVMHKFNEEKISNYVDAINRSSKNVYSLLETLLNWSRLQTNSISITPSDFRVDYLINDTLTLFKESFEVKGVSISSSFNHSHYVYADEETIKIVVRNLLSNALKFTPKGGRITINTLESNDSLIIEVIDTGVGMDEELVKNLFNGTVNKSNYGTDNEKGTGLGLVICKELINRNNATIDVKSSPNAGSCFRILLPLGKSTEPSVEENIFSDVSVIADNSETSLPIILIVDDNEEILNYIVSIFSSSFIVETATDGEEGLRKASELIPNIIITDLVMPLKSGVELCSDLKSNLLLNHIPVIILSAQSDFENQLKSIEAGAFDFVPKPFNKQMLLLKVKSILKSRNEYKNYLKKQFASEPTKFLSESDDDKFMISAHKILEKNFSDSDFSVERFAAEMGYSRSQLFRKLKAVMDITPVEYLKVYRLKRAKDILTSSNKRVSDVAYEVGFNDPMYFSSCFKSYFGQTPNNFLKKDK